MNEEPGRGFAAREPDSPLRLFKRYLDVNGSYKRFLACRLPESRFRDTHESKRFQPAVVLALFTRTRSQLETSRGATNPVSFYKPRLVTVQIADSSVLKERLPSLIDRRNL